MESLLHTDWLLMLSQSLPLLVLLATAVLVLSAGLCGCCSRTTNHESRITIYLSLIGIIAAAVLVVPRWQAATTPVQLSLWYFDRLAWVAGEIILGATLLVVLLSSSYLRARQFIKAEFLALVLLGAFGMWCMVATQHLLMIFLGIEILSLAAYVLAAYARAEPTSIEAGLKYFLMGSVASAFLLFGIAFLYGGTGSLDLLAMQKLNIMSIEGAERLYLLIGVASLLVGMAFKIAAVPFQWWAPDVYSGAPLPVTAFFATGVKAAAFLALWRIAVGVSVVTGPAWHSLLWWMAVSTILVGNLAALTQDDVKRMLAYSSIAHAGYALIALVIAPSELHIALAALLLYLLGYTVMTIGAFAVLIALNPAGSERTSLADLTGLGVRRPGLALLLAIFLFSLAGIPPTIGFFGKYFLFQAAVAAGEVKLVLIAVLGSVISVAYYVRPIVVMYFRTDAAPLGNIHPPLSRGVRAVLALTLLAVLALGLFPSPLLQWLWASVR